MWAISCIILRSGAPHQELTYFSKDAVAEGSIITIPLRGKDVQGLVLTCKSVSDLRQNIRTSTFQLRKITHPKPHHTLSRTFLRAAFEAALFSAVPPGALIATYTSAHILANRHSVPEAVPHPHKEKETRYEPLLFSHNRAERLTEYKRLARESLARGNSVVIIAPTVVEAERLAEYLSLGIAPYVVRITGALTKKKIVEEWKRGVSSDHPVIIVGTPLALSLPRHDIATIICEREGARSYVHEERPYMFAPLLAEYVARALSARFILGSTVPSLTSYARKEAGEIGDLGLSTTHLSGIDPVLIDLKEHKKEKGGYDPLTPRLVTEIKNTLAAGGHVLILAARRGLAPLTVCDDCGTSLTCTRCGATLVLHGEGGRRFLCHHCGQEESASVRCRKCGSWRLTTLGIAIDTVSNSLQKHVPETPLHIITSDTALEVKETKAVALWQEKGGILLATERVVPYLPDQIPCVGVASVDTLLGIPEYSASERACTLLSELKSRATETFLVQTRDPGHRVMRALKEGIAQHFLRDELTDRERFMYPPASVLIRFTSSGNRETVEKESAGLMNALEQFSPQKIVGRVGRRGEARVHVLIRLKAHAWVDQRLLRFIRTLPQSVEVRVNPLAIHTQ